MKDHLSPARLSGLILGGRYQLSSSAFPGDGPLWWRALDLENRKECKLRLALAAPGIGDGELATLMKMGRFQGESILPLSDVGIQKEIWFSVVNDPHGETNEELDSTAVFATDIHAYLKEQSAFSMEQIKRVLFDVLEALAVAHQTQTIHGSVGFSTVLLKARKMSRQAVGAYLTIFGANLLDSYDLGDRLRSSDFFVPPELFDVLPADPHPGIDVYSAGVLAYLLVVGDHPWKGVPRADVRLLYDQNKKLPLLNKTAQGRLLGATAGFSAIIAKAMSYAPKGRYENAGAMLSALKELEDLEGGAKKQSRSTAKVRTSPSTALVKVDALSSGTRVAEKYVVEELLDKRPGQVVYRVVDDSSQVPAALTMCLRDPHFSDEEWHSRIVSFEDQCRKLAKIRSANIPQLLHYGVQDETPFYVRELCDGRSFFSAMREEWKESGWTHVQRCLGDLAGALEQMHGEGAVHGSLRPESIVIDEDGQLQLVDLGLAGIVAPDPGSDNLEELEFVAPELLAGEPRTPATDYWSLGALAYALVTGIPPGQNNGRMMDSGVFRKRVIDGTYDPIDSFTAAKATTNNNY